MFYTSAVCEHTTKEDKRLLGELGSLIWNFREYVDTLSFKDYLVYECHSICRAISMAMPKLRLVDGNYTGMEHISTVDGLNFKLCYAAHSWLVTPDDAIIDPYPVGYLAINPVLVVNKGKYVVFGGNLYIPNPNVTAKISTRETMRKSQTLYRLIKESQK